MENSRCPVHQIPGDDDEGTGLPSAEAMLAGTLALMTGFAEHCQTSRPAPLADSGEAAAPAVTHLLAAKAASSLFFLAEHPLLSAGFRSTLWRLRSHWQVLERRVAAPPPDPRKAAPASQPEPALGTGSAFCLAASPTRH